MAARTSDVDPRHPQDGVLLTGSTGFVGMELLSRYVADSDSPVYALVRARDDCAAASRLDSLLSSLFGPGPPPAGRVTAIAADIERPGLGLSASRREWLAERVRKVVHAAASVSFSLPLGESRAINVGGTERVLELADLCHRRGGLDRFCHISTAYVAGTHEGAFTEDDLDVGQRFRNPYERSKFEAEQAIRRAGLPLQVFRPSIVVGERPTGWTASFNVLYAPLKAFARGALPVLPARRSAPVDVVPVDYVADAVFALAGRALEREEETYHLVAGSQATTVGRLVDLSARHFGRRPPVLVPPGLYRRALHPLLARRAGARRGRALQRNEVFFPYFSMRVRYDDARARAALDPVGIRVTPVERYYRRLIDFALRAQWGRRPISRAEAIGAL